MSRRSLGWCLAFKARLRKNVCSNATSDRHGRMVTVDLIRQALLEKIARDAGYDGDRANDSRTRGPGCFSRSADRILGRRVRSGWTRRGFTPSRLAFEAMGQVRDGCGTAGRIQRAAAGTEFGRCVRRRMDNL